MRAFSWRLLFKSGKMINFAGGWRISGGALSLSGSGAGTATTYGLCESMADARAVRPYIATNI